MEQQVDFVFGLKARAARVETATAERLVRRMLASYGTDELYEWYHAHTIGKLVFDIDGKPAAIDAPTLLADSLRAVHTFLGHEPACVRIAASHGPNKLSFRIFVPGYRMALADIKKRIVRLKLDKDRPFDSAIYGSNQKLRMVGSIKTKEDRRPLKLIDATGAPVAPTPDLLLDTLVQVVDPAWPLLEEAAAAGPSIQQSLDSASAKRHKAAASPTTSPPTNVPATTLVATGSQLGRVPKDETLPDELRTLLRAKGFLNVRPRRRTAGHEGYNFTCDNRTAKDPCPCCAPRFHENHNYCAYEGDTFYIVFNYSEHCNKVRLTKPATPGMEIIPCPTGDLKASVDQLDLDLTGVLIDYQGADSHLHVYEVPGTKETCAACSGSHGAPHMYSLTEVRRHHCWSLTHLGEDARCPGCFFWYSSTWAEHDVREIMTAPTPWSCAVLFERCFKGVVTCDSNGDDFKMFNGKRWVDLTTIQLSTHITTWLMDIVRKAGTMACLDSEEDKKALRRLHTFVGAAPNQENVLKKVRGLFSVHDKPEFDANPNLLGCDNCVIDLKTQPYVVRAPRVEDYVSLSTGYDFKQPSDQERADFEDFMAKIYPVEEERDFVQRFMGYALLGEVTEQYFLILSDTRKGGNGKTTIQALMTSALGQDYSIREAKQAFLYTPRYADNLNSHDAGMLAFKNKRLVFFEELSSQYSLNTERLKQVTGGSCMAVRQAHSKDTFGMPWKAKVVLLFNEGKMPNFEAGEGALIRRMLVVQHRSKFCDESTYEEERERPHTFLKGVTLPTDRFPPSVVLAWMLDGLASFRQRKLAGVPASVQGFKKDLVREHDVVATWAEEAIEVGVESDYVRQKDAAERFRRVPGGKMSIKSFKERLAAYMADRGVALVDSKWHAAESGKITSAYWGVRLIA